MTKNDIIFTDVDKDPNGNCKTHYEVGRSGAILKVETDRAAEFEEPSKTKVSVTELREAIKVNIERNQGGPSAHETYLLMSKQLFSGEELKDLGVTSEDIETADKKIAEETRKKVLLRPEASTIRR